MQDERIRTRIAALPSMSMADLKQMWWMLYDTKTPKFNRPFLEQHLAYRLQEISYGGLSGKAIETLKLLRTRKSISTKTQAFRHAHKTQTPPSRPRPNFPLLVNLSS